MAAKKSWSLSEFSRTTRPSAYRYRPLKLDTVRSVSGIMIRLLTLSRVKGKLYFGLENIDLGSLSNQHSYDAVSYVWGEPKFTEILWSEEGSSRYLEVTPRLYRILERLPTNDWAFPFRRSRFWIDAICIDQENKEECSYQVQHMARIFNRAQRVHVFLGENLLGPDPFLWLDSEWFSRRWVIQEFVAAKEVLFNCGGNYRDLGSLISMVSNYQPHSPIFNEHPSRGRALSTFLELKNIKQRKARWGSILDLLLKFEATQCKVEHDRLFALFGIATDVSPPKSTHTLAGGLKVPPNTIYLSIDYTLSAPELYIKFAEAALRTVTPFDILHCAGVFRRRNFSAARSRVAEISSVAGAASVLAVSSSFSSLLRRLPKIEAAVRLPRRVPVPSSTTERELPSWVPDWRQPALYKPLMKSAFKAGLSDSCKTPITILDNRVAIQGISLTTIQEVMASQPFPISELERFTHVNYMDRSNAPVSPMPNLDMSADRVSIKTADGVIGAAPPDVLLGDEIVLFVGARTPFVLRKMVETDAFRLVGDCFLTGVMNGEAAERMVLKTEFVIA
ncbi:heterokaryon incompatibility protein-domain-containing protein [Bisporella sp. PMI_857]|nr:heterokaryon incompatibility protein-domain-containing protein [Bisporella sp. PMI_857]